MKNERKQTRDWLTTALKTPFEHALTEAKITPRQNLIIHLKFCDNLFNYQIASRLDVSLETVRNEIKRAYDNIAKVIMTA